jgi:hypothetical protein
MSAPMRTKTKQQIIALSPGKLWNMVHQLRLHPRTLTQPEITFANKLIKVVEEQAWKESLEVRDRLLDIAQEARKMYRPPNFMFTNGDNETEGKEVVLRSEAKQSAGTSSSPGSSERQQYGPDRIASRPSPSTVHIDPNGGPQRQPGCTPHIVEDGATFNAYHGMDGHSQSVDNPSTTSYFTSNAPIYNQNINSGSGQQNIKVFGMFEPPATGATPSGYEIPVKPEHHTQRDNGQQRLFTNNPVTNSTAGNGKPGGHSQTLKIPHGLTHMRVTAPIYNQNHNTGSGQQNIDVIGKMAFEKTARPVAPAQQLPRREPSPQGPVITIKQTLDARAPAEGDLGIERREPATNQPPLQEKSPRRRSRSPRRVGEQGRSGSRDGFRDRSYGFGGARRD